MLFPITPEFLPLSSIASVCDPDFLGRSDLSRLLFEKGYLHADAYGGIQASLRAAPDNRAGELIEVACWAHARRKIYEVHAQTASPAAQLLLNRIAELFALEADIRGRTPEQRLAVRTERSAPLLARIKPEFESTLAQISGKSALAMALASGRSINSPKGWVYKF